MPYLLLQTRHVYIQKAACTEVVFSHGPNLLLQGSQPFSSQVPVDFLNDHLLRESIILEIFSQWYFLIQSVVLQIQL